MAERLCVSDRQSD